MCGTLGVSFCQTHRNEIPNPALAQTRLFAGPLIAVWGGWWGRWWIGRRWRHVIPKAHGLICGGWTFADASRHFRETFAKNCLHFRCFFSQVSFIIGTHHGEFDEMDQDHILKQQVKNEAKVILMSSSHNFREKKCYFSEPWKKDFSGGLVPDLKGHFV